MCIWMSRPFLSRWRISKRSSGQKHNLERNPCLNIHHQEIYTFQIFTAMILFGVLLWHCWLESYYQNPLWSFPDLASARLRCFQWAQSSALLGLLAHSVALCCFRAYRGVTYCLELGTGGKHQSGSAHFCCSNSKENLACLAHTSSQLITICANSGYHWMTQGTSKSSKEKEFELATSLKCYPSHQIISSSRAAMHQYDYHEQRRPLIAHAALTHYRNADHSNALLCFRWICCLGSVFYFASGSLMALCQDPPKWIED